MNSFFNKYKSLVLIGGFGLAMLLGLGVGYLLFKSENGTQNSNQSTHIHETSASEAIWTCSMHPQIRQNEPGDCPICGMDLIPLEENTSSDPLVLEMTPEAVKLAQIETSILGATDTAQRTLMLAGKIQADERRAAAQVAHIPGRIEQLYVSFKGKYVRKGQRIARIYSPELITAQQELIQAAKLKERNPGLYTSTRQKLLYWKLTEEQINEIEQSSSIEEIFDIYADASGVVTERRVAVGDYVRQGEDLFDLVNLNRVWVLFDAYEEDLAQIAVGDQIRFTTPSVPGETFSTRITFIDPLIDPQTRVASIRGEITNTGLRLKPEMFVRGLLASPLEKSGQLLVPKSAVLWTGQRSVVYLKVQGQSVPSFRYQEVELGERIGSAYAVRNGLQAGDEVVTYGSFTIDAAAQLNNQQSMMNRLLDQNEEKEVDLPNYATLTPVEFQQQLASAVEEYLSLKDALVASDEAQAKSFAEQMQSSLQKIDMTLVQGEVHAYWMSKATALGDHAAKLVQAKDIASQREQFSFLSATLIESVQVMGVRGIQLFVQYCPMALDNEGADWLSLQQEIRNPYFGDMMLTCGSVTDSLFTSVRNNAPSHSHH